MGGPDLDLAGLGEPVVGVEPADEERQARRTGRPPEFVVRPSGDGHRAAEAHPDGEVRDRQRRPQGMAVRDEPPVRCGRDAVVAERVDRGGLPEEQNVFD